MEELWTLPFTTEEVTTTKTPKQPKEKLPKIPRKPASTPSSITTPIIYRGGKTSIAPWVIGHFPPHKYFVDVFGGGAAISLAKSPSEVDVYNDIGNVSKFLSVMRDYGEELYHMLTYAPWDRAFFKHCCEKKEIMFDTVKGIWNSDDYREASKYFKLQWAMQWYVTILQSYRHEEDDGSWLVSKNVNTASSFASHIDDFPLIIDRLRRIQIENKDCIDVIKTYDSKDTLFYMDPPYLPETWEADKQGYRNIMSKEEHVTLLNLANSIQGQCVISGYPSQLYNELLNGWRVTERTRPGGIKNSSQTSADKTEVVWVKEHSRGLWTESPFT